MKYNTGNPLGSSDPRDLNDNSKILDEAIGSEQNTFKDRLGNTRMTFAGMANEAGDSSVSLQAAADALSQADRSEAQADRAEAQADRAENEVVEGIASGVSQVTGHVTSEADRAEAARDAAQLSAGIFTSTSNGLGGTTEGDYFSVPSDETDEYLILYRHDAGPTATEIERYPSANAVIRPTYVGRSNAWPDPFFRRLPIEKQYEGSFIWNGDDRSSWSFVANPEFKGRALRKSGDNTDLSGPMMDLTRLNAAPGDPIRVRAIVLGNGDDVVFVGKLRDKDLSAVGSQVGNTVTTTGSPQVVSLSFLMPSDPSVIYFNIYPYTDAGASFDILALWAGVGSDTPMWPTFNDNDYLLEVAESTRELPQKFYSQFAPVTVLDYDSKTAGIVAPSHSTAPRDAPFAGWGSQYTTPSGLSFNMVRIPEIVRGSITNDSEKWARIRIEVRALAAAGDDPDTVPLLAYGDALVSPDEDTIINLEVALRDPVSGELTTLTEADVGAQFFVGYIAYNADGGLAIAGECRGEAPEYAGHGNYYTSNWQNYDTVAIAINLYQAGNLSETEDLVPRFESGGSANPETANFDIALCPFIYHAEGRETNVYFDSLIYQRGKDYEWDVTCSRGRQLNECYRLDGAPGAGNYSLGIEIQDSGSHSSLAAASSTVRAAAASAGDGVSRKLLVVGDSTTANGLMVNEVVNLFNADVMGLTTIGTQGSISGYHEGRSGHKVSDYATVGRTWYEFTVSGIVTEPAINAAEYDHNGSTYEVQEVNVDANGDGTIICNRVSGTSDPLASGTLTKSNGADGDGTITFTSWQTTSGNPFWDDSTGQLDIAEYMTVNGFSMAADDWVVIHLGINDCFNQTSDAGVDSLTNTAFSQLNQLINAFKAYQPGLRFGLALPAVPPAEQNAFATSYGCGQTRHRFKRNIHRWALNMIGEFGGQEGNGIYLLPFNAAWDAVNNALTSAAAPVNARSEITVERQTNGVHPGPDGYEQLADVIYCALKFHE